MLSLRPEPDVTETRAFEGVSPGRISAVSALSARRKKAIHPSGKVAKFPEGYVFELTDEESAVLRSKISTIEASAQTLEPVSGKGRHSKYNFKAFTRKGLYMLATCLKSDRAADATVDIGETFDKVQTLKQELLELHKETDKAKQQSKMQHFGEVLTDTIGANVRESKHAQSDADFLSRMSIANKEADEPMEQRAQSHVCMSFAESRQRLTKSNRLLAQPPPR